MSPLKDHHFKPALAATPVPEAVIITEPIKFKNIRLFVFREIQSVIVEKLGEDMPQKAESLTQIMADIWTKANDWSDDSVIVPMGDTLIRDPSSEGEGKPAQEYFAGAYLGGARGIFKDQNDATIYIILSTVERRMDDFLGQSDLYKNTSSGIAFS